MTHKRKKVSKITAESLRGDVSWPIWWKSTVGKLTNCHLIFWAEKNRRRRSRSNSPFCPTGPISPKISYTLSSSDLCMYRPTKFGPDQLRFARVIPEILIFRTPKSHRLEPTNIQCNYNRQTNEYFSILGL